MNKSYKIFIAFVLVLGLWVGLNSLGPESPPPANAQDDLLEDILGEILEGVLEEVREEVKQDIKDDVRQDTSEVVAEEQVTGSLSGVYVGFIGGDPNTCTLTITSSFLAGKCTFPDGSATLSGSSRDGIVYTFSFKLSETNPPCSASGSGTVKVVSGTGGPGTEILVTAGSTACGGAVSGTLVKQ